MKNIIFVCGIFGALLFLVASVIGGFQIEGYSFIRQYISESYASGIPNSSYLRKMYMASGMLLACFGFMAPMGLPKSSSLRAGFIVFAVFYGLGTLVTGIFPCDMGCELDPINPSISQLIHNTMGMLTYAVVPFCLLGLGSVFRKGSNTKKLAKVSFICGILSLGFAILLFGDPTGAYRGLFQRIIEGSILFWVVYSAYQIRSTQ